MSANILDRRVYLLADHLDAILAAGEDLKRLSIGVGKLGETTETGSPSINQFASKAKTLEFAAIARIMQAREQAAALARRDDRFSVLADLFVGGTAIVIDAISHLADRDARAFMDGDDPLEYLRTRGLISADLGCLSIVQTIAIDEAFLLGGQIPLGVLLDMSAQFLDALEVHFSLFPELPAVAETKQEPVADHAAR